MVKAMQPASCCRYHKNITPSACRWASTAPRWSSDINAAWCCRAYQGGEEPQAFLDRAQKNGQEEAVAVRVETTQIQLRRREAWLTAIELPRRPAAAAAAYNMPTAGCAARRSWSAASGNMLPGRSSPALKKRLRCCMTRSREGVAHRGGQ